MAQPANQIEPLDAAECRDELERVLAGDGFRAAPRLASFLRFIVTTTLEGHGDRLKGYTIGVGALGRPPNFDPQIDPIVRVEAGRLRAALAHYYAGQGRDDPVVIELPRGGSIPTFRRSNLPIGLRKCSYSSCRAVFHKVPGCSRFVAQVAIFATVAGVLVSVVTLAWWRPATVAPTDSSSTWNPGAQVVSPSRWCWSDRSKPLDCPMTAPSQ